MNRFNDLPHENWYSNGVPGMHDVPKDKEQRRESVREFTRAYGSNHPLTRLLRAFVIYDELQELDRKSIEKVRNTITRAYTDVQQDLDEAIQYRLES